ncbi:MULTISPECIES: PdaC/SigV domain-containing protein [Butyricimonas]|uniref:PdaC/SigV domain-containing protein n=1 Tax=Butyricimonas TaxID=574697 RepID=UPI001D063A7C|nr:MULTISPECIES: DUF4163 domain-containing protein [Butyricimonas]MCB6972268.1 DUF4163 domain-containing protein [Butyricimonas synergistica]MCG4519169.1 DUF4163 domain-containing protein [Butyricimonas sp. DFI.6.44]
MRRCIFIAALLALFFVGCQKPTINIEENMLSYTNNEWDVSVNRPVFSAQNAALEKGCKEVNERVTKLIDSLQNDLKEQMKEYLQEAQEMKINPMIPFTLDIQDSVFMADDRYISLRLVVYTLTGGANGLTEYYAFNYSMKQGKFLEPEDILNYNKSAEIDKQIKTNFKNPDNCFTDVPTLSNVTTVNFSTNDICFTYDPLVLGAHYCGAAQVSVPRMILKGDLLLK